MSMGSAVCDQGVGECECVGGSEGSVACDGVWRQMSGVRHCGSDERSFICGRVRGFLTTI